MDSVAKEVMGRTNVLTILRAEVTGALSNNSPSQQSPPFYKVKIQLNHDGPLSRMEEFWE